MAVDRIKHTKPASKRTFLDELEPIPYEITEEELANMDPRMKKILFGIKEEEDAGEISVAGAAEEATTEEDWYEDVEEEVVDEEVEEPVEEEPDVDVIYVEFDPEPEPQPFDYASLADDLPEMENPNVTFIFQAERNERDLIELAQKADDYKREEVEGKFWHVCRFSKKNPDVLRKLNRDVGDREGAVALFNGKKTAYGRNLWLPLMYIFGSDKPYY